MKVIEQLVEHLRSQGSLGDAEVSWLREHGFLPSLSELDHEDLSEYVDRKWYVEAAALAQYEASGLASLDEIEEEQTQRDLLRNRKGSFKDQTKDKRGSGAAKPKPRRAAEHYEQRKVADDIRSSEQLSRSAAIKSLLNCLDSVQPSFHTALIETLATIASQSADSFTDVLLELHRARLLDSYFLDHDMDEERMEKWVHSRMPEIARKALEYSGERSNDLLYALSKQRNTFNAHTKRFNEILSWLFVEVLTDEQEELILELDCKSSDEKEASLLGKFLSLQFYMNKCNSDYIDSEHASDYPSTVRLELGEAVPLWIDPRELFQYSVHKFSVVRKLTREVMEKGNFPVVDEASELFAHLENADPHVVLYAACNLDAAKLEPPKEKIYVLNQYLVRSDLDALRFYSACNLARYRGPLRLHSVFKISYLEARALAMHEGSLTIGGLTRLPDSSATLLSQHVGGLSFPQLEKISWKAAQSLSKTDGGGLDFAALECLSLDVARELANFRGDRLGLAAVRYLQVGVAKALARFQGWELDLSGLSKISPDVAEQLASFHGWLKLDGIESLSDAAANALGSQQHYLSLGKLESISESAALGLGKHTGRLWLGLKTASKAVVAGLCPNSNCQRDFPDLERLCDDAALKLSELQVAPYLPSWANASDSPGHLTLLKKLCERESLYFSNLKELTEQQAQILTRYDGKLELPGLRKLPDSPYHIALALKLRAESDSHDRCLKFRRLIRRLNIIGSEVADRISDVTSELDLPSLAVLSDSPGHLKLARKLSQNERQEYYELTSLAPAAAEQLSQSRSILSFYALRAASDALLEALSGHQGPALGLYAIERLSDVGAEHLSKHQGQLNLESLRYLSDRAAKVLCRHNGKVIVNCDQLPDSAAAILRASAVAEAP